MGACCSCQWGGKFEGFHVEEEENIKREVEDLEDIVLRGDAGARIRLQGSSKYISMFSRQGRKGVNQDAMTVWESFSGDRDMFFCAMFDGHGPSGHEVSRYVRDLLPAKISAISKQPITTDGKNYTLDINNANEKSLENPESKNPFFLSWKDRLTKCFHEMDQELEEDATTESYCSGTTSVCVLKKGEHLVIANLGDSRAVLCKRDDNNKLVPEQLTVDMKPNLPNEEQRIRSCQGRVLSMEEEPNVYRVWMPDQDCPGLAMARAFGDFCLKDFGVISTPEVTYRKLTERDEFVVLATDGVWDVLSNNEVVKIVASTRKRGMAAKLVTERAVRAWRYKYPCAKIDDCAVVCLFFKRPRPLLTKSMSETTHLSLNYSALGGNNAHARSMKSDDELDTVLNCGILHGRLESGENGVGRQPDSTIKRPRKRRPAGRRFDEHGRES